MRKYFTLLSRSDKGEDWGIEFGDYSKKVVQEEQAEMVDGFGSVLKMSDTKIITTGDKQADINAAVKKLNADWRNN